MVTLDELKQEAKELGIDFSANIGVAKLQTKIDEYYTSQETSGIEIQEEVEESEEKPAVIGKEKKTSMRSKAIAAEEAARVTHVVTIIDNDARVNNQTTVATVSCSNMYFDLGTAHIPLNIPIEIRQGHIDILKGIEIPQHIKDPATGLTRVTVRPRYTVSFEQVK